METGSPPGTLFNKHKSTPVKMLDVRLSHSTREKKNIGFTLDVLHLWKWTDTFGPLCVVVIRPIMTLLSAEPANDCRGIAVR